MGKTSKRLSLKELNERISGLRKLTEASLSQIEDLAKEKTVKAKAKLASEIGAETKFTTIKVTRKTLKELEYLRRRLNVKTLEDVIERLIHERRRTILKQALGLDRGKISSFREEDRGEDRS